MIREKLRQYDNKLIAQGLEKGLEKGRERGIQTCTEKMVLGMLEKKVDEKIIRELSGYSKQKLKWLKEKT